jgi:site-specific recombinase XerD
VQWSEGGERHRRSLGASTHEQALDTAAEIERRTKRGLRVSAPGRKAFAEVWALFIEDKAARREEATLIGYRKTGRKLAEYGFPVAARIEDITPEDVSSYLARRIAGGLSRFSANKERSTLSTLYRWAIRRGMCDRSPVEAVEPFSVRPKRPEACPEELFREVQRALRQPYDPSVRECELTSRALMADCMLIMWSMGLRVGEVCAIEPRDVRIGDLTLTVRSASNKGPADLPIPIEMASVFQRHLDRRHPTVFANMLGRPALSALEHCWAEWLRGHPEHAPAHFHALRHSYQARLERAMVDPGVIQRLMRHSTLRMHDRYSHREVEALRRARAELD